MENTGVACAPATLADAARLLECGDFPAAERAALGLLAQAEDCDALHLLGLVRMQQGRLDEAEKLIRRSLALRPGHPFVLLNLAKLLVLFQRDGEAGPVLEEVLSLRPNLAEAWAELGELRIRAGDAAGAESSLRKALALEPGHALARLWLGVVVKKCERNAEAEAILAQGLDGAGDSQVKAALHYHRGFAQYNQGKKAAALESFALAGHLDDGSLNTEIARADLLEEMLRFDEAAELLEQTVARNPANAAAHIAYNYLLHRLGRNDEFLKSYDQAPHDPVLQSGKAGFLLKIGRLDEAWDAYAEQHRRDAGNLDASIGLANILAQRGQASEAIAYLEQAVLHHPKNAMLHHNFAAAALQAGDAKKAAAMAEKSLALAPGDQTGFALLGSAWRMLGDQRDDMLNGYDELIQVFDLEPPVGFSSMAAFNEELNAWLDSLHPEKRQPLLQPLRHGSQTRGFLFGRGHLLADKLKTRIDAAIEDYLAGIKADERHPFRGRKGRGFRVSDSWSTRLTDCGYHLNHLHPGGWISSCYYVDVPEAVKDKEQKQGWIKFGEPNFDAGLGVRRTVQPAAGRLVLFPSYMWHGTIPFRGESSRTTIAFDALPASQ